MENLPEGFQLEEQAPSTEPTLPQGFELEEDKYGGLGQQALAGAEAVGRGLVGPLAPMAERAVGVSPEAMRGREAANPITSTLGEAAGLTTGLLTGTGEAAAMTKAGELATEAAGLTGATSYGMKVGASAVQQAAEMAVLQGGNEVSKMLMSDPEVSAESAIANVGMAAALGGAGGAFITGAVSPLWKATGAPKVEAILNGLKEHLDGGAAIVPEATESALTNLGIEVSPEIRAVLTKNPAAIERFNVLKEVQNKHVTEGLDNFNQEISNAVARRMRIDPAEVENYSESEAGNKLLDTFKKEYKDKYEPIAEALDKRNAEAVNMPVSDNARLETYGRVLENGMEKVGTDSPYYKLYSDYGNRILNKDTVGGLDMLKTEINGGIKQAIRAGDSNTQIALQDIKSTISDLQEAQIEKLGAVDKIAERQAANAQYREFSKMSDELASNLNVGHFKGAGNLTSKLTDQVTAEQLLNKFSIRNNADFISFLQKNFPETLKEVQQNELKRMIKPAVLSAKEGTQINVNKLSDIVAKAMAGQKEYVEAVMGKDAMQAVEAAKMLQDSIPKPKSSGTAGWMSKVYSKMPQSAMAAVAMVTGHNPAIGYLIGEMGHALGRYAPDAINLGYLRWLGSTQPVKAEGFKAMVDFVHNASKADGAINKAVANIFTGSGRVLTSAQMPSKASLVKLDKIVAKNTDAPNNVYATQNGHVGHYLPDHQTSLAEVSTRAQQYLQSIKPRPFQSSPLDKPIDPPKSEMARYNRALEIAQQPAIVLQHIKDGTLQESDMQDLGSMYPALYKSMASKVSNEMVNNQSEERNIPYKTRIALSLFLGQALDSSMSPQAINTAQMTYALKAQQQSQDASKPKKGTSTLGKSNKEYRTPIQASEAQDSTRK